MTTKTDSETPRGVNDEAVLDVLARKVLLATVAGHVATGLLTSPSPKVDKPEKLATVAVELAEAILKRAGV